MEVICSGKASEIYSTLKAKVSHFQETGKLKYLEKVSFDDARYSASCQGSGFKCSIQCQDGKIIIDLNLSLPLKPFRSTIEAKIKTTVGQILA